MAITGALAAAARVFDPYPEAILALDFAGVRTGGRQFYKRDGIIVPRFEMLRGVSSVGGAGFGAALVNGVYRPFAADAPLIGDGGLLVPEARTNYYTNINMAGAVVGVVGAGGALPDGWFLSSWPAGAAVEVVSLDPLRGSIVLRVSGENSTGSTVFPIIGEMPKNGVVASRGQTWTHQLYARQVDGERPSNTTLRIGEATSGGGDLSNGGAPFIPATAAYLHEFSRTLSNSSVARAFPYLGFQFSAGASFDWTVELSVNFKLGSAINDPPILQTTGLPATRTAVAQSVGGLVLPPVFTVIAEADIPHAPDGLGAHTLVSGGSTFSDCWSLTRRDVSGGWQAFVRAGGVTQFDVIFGLLFSGPVKMAARIEANNFRVAMNGTLSGLDTNGSVPTTSNVRFGSSSWAGAGSDALNGVVSRVSILPFGAPDAQLQALTA